MTAQGYVFSQSADGFEPRVGTVRPKTRDAGLDEVRLNADWIGHDRQARGHKLQHLQSAFASAPKIVGQPANADVGGGNRVLPILATMNMVGYSLLISIGPGELWLHPFGPVTKNIPLIIATLIMMALERD